MKKPRDSWAGRIGIILAVAGSAVGLGNFLRFPGIAAQNGGGAFMIPYFTAFLLLGLPLCWVEWTLGRFGGTHGHGGAPGIFDRLAGGRPWVKYLGILGLLGPLGIFFYYIYIEAWTLAYSFFSLAGWYRDIADPQGMSTFLGDFLGAPDGRFQGRRLAYGFFLLTFAVNFAILHHGISRGIERFCRITMPILFAAAIAIAIRVMLLGTPDPAHPDWNIANGFGFLWNPRFDLLKEPKVWLAAAGQIFFTLSIGMGCIMTYASYLKAKHDLTLSSLSAAFMNEVAEVILGASIVIPAAYCFFGAVGTQTAVEGGTFGLGFRTMPLIFNHIAGGPFFGFIWFILLFIAGITSSISMLQPAVAFLEEHFQIGRTRVVTILAAIAFAGAHLAIFCDGAMDEMDFWFSSFGLPLFALIEMWVFLKLMGLDRGWHLLHQGAIVRIPTVFRFVLRWITPLLLAAILIAWLVTDGWQVIIMHRRTAEGWQAIYTPQQTFGVVAARLLYLTLIVATGLLIRRGLRTPQKEP